MVLPSFLKRKVPATAAPDDATIVQNARTRARRRLIGAAVLLGIGVISFPLLFETQPRPIPVDIPIVIPRKDGLPPLNPPARVARQATGQVADAAAKPVAEPVAAAPAPAAPTVARAPAAAAAPKPAAPPAPAPAASSPAAAVAKPKPAASAPSLAAAASSAAAAAPAEAGRFVVQVGAFADAGAAREVRLKVEKLGLKTYTQVVETAQGKRIRVRVGPFDKPDEATKVLDRLKAAKLPGAVLTL